MEKQPKRMLSRKEAAEFLSAIGYKIAPATLAKLVSIGGSPPFQRFGSRPVYDEESLLAWAKARTTRSFERDVI